MKPALGGTLDYRWSRACARRLRSTFHVDPLVGVAGKQVGEDARIDLLEAPMGSRDTCSAPGRKSAPGPRLLLPCSAPAKQECWVIVTSQIMRSNDVVAESVKPIGEER